MSKKVSSIQGLTPTNKQGHHDKRRRRAHARYSQKNALEPRILFDAAAAAAALPIVDTSTHTDTTTSHTTSAEHSTDSSSSTEITRTQSPALSDFRIYHQNQDRNHSHHNRDNASDRQDRSYHWQTEATTEPTQANNDSNGHEILFVESSFRNYQRMVENTRSNIEIITLDANQDIFDQITNTLSNRHDISSIHIIGHNHHGDMTVGNESFSSQALDEHAQEINNWRDSLTSNANIFLYGANGRHVEANQSFLNDFSNLAGAHIFAAKNSVFDYTFLKPPQALEMQVHSRAQFGDGSCDTHLNAIIDSSKSYDEVDILFVNRGTDPSEYQKLIDYADDHVQIIFLDPNRDGYYQVTKALSSIENVSDFYFLADDAGVVELGRNTLSAEDLNSHSTQVSSWKDGLPETGLILIYADESFGVGATSHEGLDHFSQVAGKTVLSETIINNLIFYDPVVNFNEGSAAPVYTVGSWGGYTFQLSGPDAAYFRVGPNFDNSVAYLFFNSSPDFETKTSYDVTVTSTFTLNQNQSQVQVIVNITNVAPVVPNPGQIIEVTANEGASTGLYTLVAPDPAGGTVTYSLNPGDTADNSAFSINSSTGVISFNSTLDFDTKTSYFLYVTAADSSGLASYQAIRFTVSNQAPVFSSSSAAIVNENIAGGSTVYTAVAPDPGGGNVTYSLVPGGDASSFSINSSTGIVTINAIPNFETKSSYFFTVRSQDSSGLFTDKIITLAINDLPPVFSSGTTASINEGVAAATTVYTAIAADPAGGTVTYSLVAGGDAASFSINSSTGVVTINASPNFETKSSYTFTVRAQDPSSLFVDRTVTLTINNLAPTFSSGTTASINEGVAAGSTAYTAIAADPAGGTVTYSLVAGGDAASFSINSSTGIVTINAIPNFETKSSYTFTVRAQDPSSLFVDRTVTLTINNQAPAFSSGTTASINEGVAAGSTVYTAIAADPAGGTVTYSLVAGGDAASFSINSSTGIVTINAIPNFETKSSYTFTVRAQDPSSLFVDRTVTLTINNQAPAFSSATTASINEGVAAGSTVYTAVAPDPAGGTVTYSLVAGGDAASFSINSSSGVVTINASPNFETKSSYTFTVRAQDPAGLFNTRAVTLTINNLAPAFSSATTASVNEGVAAGSTVYTAIAADPAGGTVTYSLVAGGDAASFSINSSTGAVTINASPNFETKSSYTFTVRAQDPSSSFVDRAVTLTINNQAPAFSSSTTASVNEGVAAGSTVYTAIAADPAGGTVTYSLVASGDAASFSINSSTGAVTINAMPDFETKSSYTFTVRAQDPSSSFVDRTVTLTINNLAPVFSSGTTAITNEGVSPTTTVYEAAATDPAGGTVTYSLSGTDADAFIMYPNGIVGIKNTPDFDTKNSYSFNVIATDSSNASTTQSVTLTIINLPPVFSSGTTANINEGVAAGTTVYTAIAPDPAGGNVTYSLLPGGDASAFSINSSTGAVTINASPDFETKNSYSFTVRATDDYGQFSPPQTITLTINELAPVFSSDTIANINEGVAAGTTVYTAIAPDPGGGTVTYSLVAGGDASAFSINSSTGVVTINTMPDFETKSSYTFTVRAQDSSGLFNTRTVTLTVNNLAPVFSSGTTAITNEGVSPTTTVYEAIATDPAGGTVTYSLSGTDADAFIMYPNGIVGIKDTPDFDTKNTYSFNVIATDSSNASTTQSVTLTIINLPPVFSSGTTANITEGVAAGTTVYTAIAPDPAGGNVTYSLLPGGDASAFSINSSTGVVTINTSPDFEIKNSYSFTVRATDDYGRFSPPQVITLTINELPPVFSSSTTANINEAVAAGSTVYTAVAADLNSVPVTYSLLPGGDASAFSINSSTGVVTINASPDFETKNSYSFNVKATGTHGSFSTQTITLSINNLAPNIISGTTASINEGIAAGSTVYTAVAPDPAGGTVTYSLVAGDDAASFSINSSTGAVTINASPNFETKNSYTFTVRAQDSAGLFVDRTVTLSINNQAPVFSSSTTASVNEGVSENTIVYTAAATDPAGGSTVTYSLSGTDAAAFSINSSTGIVTINSIPNFETKSSYTFNVNAADSSGLFNTQTVTLTVNNLAPVFATGTTASMNEGVAAGTTIYTATANDPAGGTVTYSLSGTDASDFSINSSTGAVTINATPDFETKSTYSFDVIATDANGTFSTQTITLSIDNLAPSITSGGLVNVNEGVPAGTAIYTISATDPAGGTLTYSLLGTDASAFTVDSSGVVTINASPDYETKSSYNITVRATDSSGAFGENIVDIFISNQSPTFSNGSSVTTSINESVAQNSIVYTALATDPAGGTVNYTIGGTDASDFSINSSTGVVRINSVPDFETKNSYTFTVSAADSNGLFNTQTVTLTINDLAPVISSGSTASVSEGIAAGSTVYTVSASDPAGGSVTYSLVAGGDASDFSINSANGIVTINASPDFETKNSYSFTVKAADDNGVFNTRTVTLTINNLAPNITSGSTASINEGVTAGTTVYTAVAADPNGGNLTYSLQGTDASVFSIDSSSGVVTINSIPDFETKNSYSFDVVVTDPYGLADTRTVTLSVNNLAPNFSSGTTANLSEGVPANTLVYTAVANDPAGGTVTYALSGTDASAFSVNSSTGVVTINASPDYETKSSYNITVRATDPNGAFEDNIVDIFINNLTPTIIAYNENTPVSTDLYQPVILGASYQLTGPDAAEFNMTGNQLRFNVIRDYESQTAYEVTINSYDDFNQLIGTEQVIVNINDLAPVISSGSTASVSEGIAAGSTVYTVSASDPAGGSVTYSLVAGGDANDFSINSANGIVTINASPDFETKNSYSFTVKAADDSGVFNTRTVTLTINNLAPNITSGSIASINEGLPAGSTVYTAVANDPAGGTVTYSLIAGSDASAFSINSSTGIVTINASPDFETKSSYSFDVKARDANGLFNTQTITLSINNLAPNITSSTTANINEAVAAGTTVYTAIAVDPAGGTVTYSLSGDDASAFSIDSSTGVVKISTSPDFETKSSYSFDVIAADDNGLFNTQTITLTINNLAPNIISGSTASINEGFSTDMIFYTAVAVDPNGGNVTYSLQGTDASAFSIDSFTGDVTINSIPDFETKSSYSFDVVATDDNGLFNTKTITLTINDLAPNIISGTTVSINEGFPADTTFYTAVAVDPNGGNVTYSLQGTDASAFSIDSSTGDVTLNAPPDFETKNSYTFTVKAADDNGVFNTQTVTLTINDLAPAITGGTTASVNEGVAAGTSVYTATASDPAGGTVTYSLVAGGDASAFSINNSTGVVTINATPDYETKNSYTFTVKATDDNGVFNTQTITLTVNDLAPNITSGTTANVNEGVASGTSVYTAIAADPAGGAVTYSLSGADASAFSINSSTGVVTINATPDYETKNGYSFDVVATDAYGLANTRTVTLSVNNLAPNFSSGTTANLSEGVPANTLVYTAVANDPAGGTVTYALSGTDASAFSINSSTGVVTINAIPDYETKSSYSFIVTASDSNGLFNTRAITLSINNLAPTITSGIDASINEGVAANTAVYTASATDPAGGIITYALTGTDASAFSINSSTGVVTINASPDYETKNSYSLTVRASDSSGMFTTQAITITVNDLPPIITSSTTANINEGVAAGTSVYTAVANDVSGGTVTYSLSGADASAFSINSSTGVVTINASPNYETKNSYSFDIRASDDNGMLNTQTVTLSINNLAPSITSAISASVNEGINVGSTVYTATAVDPAGGTVTYGLSGADAADFSINSSTGVVTMNVSPNYETKNSYSFDIEVTDAYGLLNTQTVTLNINNLPPVIISSTSAVDINDGVPAGSTVYTAMAIDPSGGSITYSLSGADASAFSIDNTTGTVTLVASPHYATKNSYSVNVIASDANGASSSQSLMMNVLSAQPTSNTNTTNTSNGLQGSVINVLNTGDAPSAGTSNSLLTDSSNPESTLPAPPNFLGLDEKAITLNNAIPEAVVIEDITYNVSTSGVYGTLHFNTKTGEYIYIPDKTIVNHLDYTNTNIFKDHFILTTHQNGESKNFLFTVNISEKKNHPLISASIAAVTPSEFLGFTKGITGEKVVGTVHYRAVDEKYSAEVSSTQSNTGSFDSHLTDLLKDFGLTKE